MARHVAPGLGDCVFGEMMVVIGYVEYGSIACWWEFVVGVIFQDIAGSSGSCMVELGGWKGKWVLCGIV